MSVLGAAMLNRSSRELIVTTLDGTDFYSPRHTSIFQAIANLQAAGNPVDHVTVADELRVMGAKVDEAYLVTVKAETASATVASAKRYCEIVRRDATARRLMFTARDTLDMLGNGGDPYARAGEIATDCAQLDRVGILPAGYSTFDALLDEPDEADAWLIPDICYADNRIVIIATEKSGKSVLLRQIAFCASQGVHPFTFKPMDPIRVLVLDLENPKRELKATGFLLRHRLVRQLTQEGKEYDPSRLAIFRRPQRIDLRNRHDRGELEAVMESFRPQLVVGGPVYRMSRMGEDEEGAVYTVGTVQAVLDDLRIRYSCALILEHHAPIAGRKDGPLRGFGGMLWMAWPDVTVSLEASEAEGDQRFVVRRPHPERGTYDWPKEFVRSNHWPWVATWKHSNPALLAPEPEMEQF